MRYLPILALGGCLLTLTLAGCDGGSSDGSGGSSSSSGFFSLFSASSNSEPASISANSAGAVDANAEPHGL